MDKTTTSSSSRVGGNPKLGLRLATLQSYYTNQEHVWDIGCDHGLLGLSFTQRETVKSIELVDPSEKVIDSLKKKLKDSYISEPEIFVHHKEGQSIEPYPQSNLIFIAGMGGLEIGDIISSILPKLDETSTFVISPHRKILELRELLHSLPVSLVSEMVMEDGGQYYQMLEINPSPNGMKVPLYGNKLWESETGEKYRNYQINYFSHHKDLASQRYVSHLKTLNPSKTIPKENL